MNYVIYFNLYNIPIQEKQTKPIETNLSFRYGTLYKHCLLSISNIPESIGKGISRHK